MNQREQAIYLLATMRNMDVEPEVMIESIKDITKLDEKEITAIVQEVLQFDGELVNSADKLKKKQDVQDSNVGNSSTEFDTQSKA